LLSYIKVVFDILLAAGHLFPAAVMCHALFFSWRKIMHKKLILSITFIFLINNLLFSIKYNIKEVVNEEKAQYNFKLFYPIYYIYNGIFDALNLYDKLNFSEKFEITKKLINIMSNNNQLILTFYNYLDNKDLIVTLKPTHPPKYPDDTVYFLISNFDKNKNQIVEGDDIKDAYAILLFFRNNKLIKINKLFDENKEKELITNNKNNSLADLYLFDEINENDNKIEQLLLSEIEKLEDVKNKFFCYITLSEYYTSVEKFIEAKKYLNLGKSALENVEKNKEKHEHYINILNDIIKTLSDLKK